jgi:arylsulfatase A-like enzyme
MDQVRRMFDGYDLGIHYADSYVGKLFEALGKEGVLDNTAIIISSDHGENLGEFNIYGDHQTADLITTHVPMIIRWPGVTDSNRGRVDTGLYYQNDFAATSVELAGGKLPPNWDGQAFTQALRQGQPAGRDYLVVSQNAWSCQRSVRFRYSDHDYMCIRSYHDGLHAFPDVMLFDAVSDPNEQHDLAPTKPEVVAYAMARLDEWVGNMLRTASHGQDPLWTVMREGGPLHTRGELPKYLQRLRDTGRGQWADRLAAAHPKEAGEPRKA